MKKIIEITEIETMPDWSVSPKQKPGIYLTGGYLYFYDGYNNYAPGVLYNGTPVEALFKDLEPERVSEREREINGVRLRETFSGNPISLNDVTKLVIAIRAFPENLKMPEGKS
jgi:hypothetical protein